MSAVEATHHSASSSASCPSPSGRRSADDSVLARAERSSRQTGHLRPEPCMRSHWVRQPAQRTSRGLREAPRLGAGERWLYGPLQKMCPHGVSTFSSGGSRQHAHASFFCTSSSIDLALRFGARGCLRITRSEWYSCSACVEAAHPGSERTAELRCRVLLTHRVDGVRLLRGPRARKLRLESATAEPDLGDCPDMQTRRTGRLELHLHPVALPHIVLLRPVGVVDDRKAAWRGLATFGLRLPLDTPTPLPGTGAIG